MPSNPMPTDGVLMSLTLGLVHGRESPRIDALLHVETVTIAYMLPFHPLVHLYNMQWTIHFPDLP